MNSQDTLSLGWMQCGIFRGNEKKRFIEKWKKDIETDREDGQRKRKVSLSNARVLRGQCPDTVGLLTLAWWKQREEENGQGVAGRVIKNEIKERK